MAIQSLPNILIIKADQLCCHALDFMGNQIIKIPFLNQLSRESLIFENAFCVCPLCVSSRSSFFTGQYVHRSGSIDNSQSSHIQREQWNFAAVVKSLGYALGFIGKNHTFENRYLTDLFDVCQEYTEWGKVSGDINEADLAVMRFRKTEKRKEFQSVENIGFMEGLIEDPEPFSEEHCITHRIVEDAVNLLKENSRKPFLLYCSFPDPHFPNVVCEPYYSMYPPESIPDFPARDIERTDHPFKHYVQSQASGYDKYTIEQRKRILATYYGQITFFNKSVGTLLTEPYR